MPVCPKCGKTLCNQSRLDYHLTNNVCDKGAKDCPTCGKSFKNKRNCQYHIDQNVCGKQKIKLVLKSKKEPDEKSREELLSEIAEWKGKYNTLQENPQVVSNNNNTFNNVVVFPNAFGNEDMSHIQQKLGDILGPLIKNQTFQCIPNLFTKMHNNIQLPEYHNVYLSNERTPYAMISDGSKFNHKTKKTVIDQIIEDKRSILNDYVDNNGYQLGEKVLKKYERYQELLDTDVQFKKDLELEIGGLLLDMQSVIAGDDKTRLLLDKVCEGDFELQQVPPT